jgi:heme/copper-type cytochrome/quinol oxidase subunit 3
VVAPIPLRRREPPRSTARVQLLPSSVLAMLIFVVTELMFFAGFVSAFTIMRGSAVIWPPLDQPRLPVGETAFNSSLLIASGLVLYAAGRVFRARPDLARKLMLGAIALGSGFVLLQGREWVQLLAQGLTLHSSALGSFFYLIVGTHALHAVVALGVLVWVWFRMGREAIPRATLATAEIFWYFVVGVWPVLYWRVYLA